MARNVFSRNAPINVANMAAENVMNVPFSGIIYHLILRESFVLSLVGRGRGAPFVYDESFLVAWTVIITFLSPGVLPD